MSFGHFVLTVFFPDAAQAMWHCVQTNLTGSSIFISEYWMVSLVPQALPPHDDDEQ